MLQSLLSKTLEDYRLEWQNRVTRGPAAKAFAIWFTDQATLLQGGFKCLTPYTAPNGDVTASTGAGDFPETPWIGFRSARFTPLGNFRSGIYVAYLFSKKRREATLCLIQGVTGRSVAGKSLPKPKTSEFPLLDSRTAALRFHLAIPDNFRLSQFDLAAVQVRGQAYVHGTVCGKTYKHNAMPDEAALEQDLQEMIALYESMPADIESRLNEFIALNGGPVHQANNSLDDDPKESDIGERHPLKSIASGNDSDPEARRQANDRRVDAHWKLVKALERLAIASGLSAKKTKYIDLVAYQQRPANAAVIIEVKSLYDDDADQARAAVGQLFLYRFLHRQYTNAGLIAAFSRRPSYRGKDLVAWLEDCGIGVVWRAEEGSFESSTLAQKLAPWIQSNERRQGGRR